jgi:hypothetical protein
MKLQCVLLITLLFANLLRGQDAAPALRITVVAGEGARQNVNQRARVEPVEPVVQVSDEKGVPVAGAEVVFTLPDQGPGGTFEGGSKTQTITADAQGRAAAHGILLNRLKGTYNIRVTASDRGRSANTTISQTSVSAFTRAYGPLGVSNRAWIMLGIAALVIAGGIIAARQFRSGPNPNVLTATPGTPVVGAPK